MYWYHGIGQNLKLCSDSFASAVDYGNCTEREGEILYLLVYAWSAIIRFQLKHQMTCSSSLFLLRSEDNKVTF